MKKLLVILLSVFTLNTSAQDGLVKYIDTDSTDTFISIYNSPADTRVDIAKTLYNMIIQQPEFKTGDYIFVIDENVIRGEMFMMEGSNYILYDFYIDEVRYSDGKSYRATRHQKPNGPWDYYKY